MQSCSDDTAQGCGMMDVAWAGIVLARLLVLRLYKRSIRVAVNYSQSWSTENGYQFQPGGHERILLPLTPQKQRSDGLLPREVLCCCSELGRSGRSLNICTSNFSVLLQHKY